MVALGNYRELLCRCGCGHLASVSQAKENDDRWDVHIVRCHARTAILIHAAAAQDKPHKEALMFRAELRD
jgi:hypothetical protein